MAGQQNRVDSSVWLTVYNEHDTPVPPFGVMLVTGLDEDGIITITRPDADSLSDVFVNGNSPIQPSGYGDGTRTDPCTVLVETADGTAENGDDYGTAEDSWKLHKDKRGFRAIDASVENDNTIEALFLAGGSSDTGSTSPSGCDLAALAITDCLEAVGPSNTVYLEYTEGSDGATWVSTEDLEYPHDDSPGELVFWFADGTLHLNLAGDELLYCGDGCWRGGPLTGHVEASEDSCASATFTVCLSCACCSIPGWGGPGWYCIEDESEDCAEVVLLEDGDRCDTDIVICSGPYETQALAEAICDDDPDEVTRACSGEMSEDAVTLARYVAKTGDCTCLPDEPSLDYVPMGGEWSIDTASCPGNVTFTLSCDGGFYTLVAGSPGFTIKLIAASATQLVYLITGYGANCGGGGGTAHLIFDGDFPT